jgi:hypothetical protein
MDMIRLKHYMRLKISNRLAASAAVMLLVSSAAGPISLVQVEESFAAAQQQESNLEDAVADLASVASAVGQSTTSALKISSLIFRF